MTTDTPGSAAASFSPDGHEMLVVSWSAVPGRHPELGRGSWNVIITDRRIVIAKASWKQKLARGAAIGAGMSAGLGGVAQAVTASAVAGVGAALSQSPIPKIDEGRIHEAAALDLALEALGDERRQTELDQVSAMLFRKGGIFSDSKVVITLPEGDFTGDIGGVKDAFKVFSTLLPNRVTLK